MSNLREAAQKAVSALEEFLYCGVEKDSDIEREPLLKSLSDAMTLLDTALGDEPDNEALLADAERYRWLRDTNRTRPDMTDGSRVILEPNQVISIWFGVPEERWDLMFNALHCPTGVDFDAAIDAAISKAGEQP